MQVFTDLEVRVREFAASVMRRTDGATAVEYALMVALIAVVIILAVTVLGQNVSTTFDSVSDAIPG